MRGPASPKDWLGLLPFLAEGPDSIFHKLTNYLAVKYWGTILTTIMYALETYWYFCITDLNVQLWNELRQRGVVTKTQKENIIVSAYLL